MIVEDITRDRVDMLPSEVEGSAGYQAMLVAATEKPERAMGDSIIPAKPPDWKDVKRLANSLLSDPPHLSVLIHLVKAAANCDGFSEMHNCLERTRQQLSDHWESVYPLADPDDSDDPFYERVNLLQEIGEDPAFIKCLHEVNLVEVRGLGAFSARDIDIATGVVSGTEDELARCQEGLIRGAFQGADALQLQQTHDDLVNVPECCVAIQSLFDQFGGSNHGLSFAPLFKATETILKKVQDYGSEVLQQQAATAIEPSLEHSNYQEAAGAPEAAENTQPARPKASTSNFVDRDHVYEALNQIIAYYRKFEPSSPVLIFALRARDLVHQSFFDTLQGLSSAESKDLPSILNALTINPLSYIVSDSFRRFSAGELAFDGNSEAVESPVQDVNREDSDSSGSSTDSEHCSQEAASSEASQTTTVSTAVVSAGLSNRDQVMQLLGQIELFYSQNEPASPIPLIVMEMRKLLPKSFTEIIAELNRMLNPEPDTSE